MRTKFIYLFIYLFIYSCKGQQMPSIDVETKDVLVFEYFNKISFSEDKYNQKFYFDDKYIIITQRWNAYGSHYINKQYSFIQGKDTMNINCRCGQDRNFYFKNLEFKRGEFELSFDYGKKYNEQSKKYEIIRNTILGNKIKVPKKAQNILFKNIYTSGSGERIIRQDLLFKDLKFHEIDLKDTINVHLKEIDSF